MSQINNGELKRVVGVWGLALTIVNFVVGAGIFVLPALVGIQLGSFAVFGYIFCGIMLTSIMLCYAEIGTRITTSGGSYAYVKAAFGDFPAYIINWLFMFAWSLLADAALMNIFADSLAVMMPVFTNFWIRALLFLVSIGFMTTVNILGVKKGVSIIKLFTIVKLLPLFGIIIFGFGHIRQDALHWENLPPIKTFGNAMLVLFFAYSGFESALNMSGELKNPRRTVPMGIMLGGLFVVILYLLLQYVTQGVLGDELEASKAAPLAAVAEKIVGPVGGKILLLTAALSCFLSNLADILNGPRLLYAGAKDGLFPALFAKTHPKYATPHWAIIIYAALILIISIGGGFETLAILASTAILLIYLAVVLSTIRLRYKTPGSAADIFRMPGGMLFPIIAIATIIWLLIHLEKKEIISTLIFIAIACMMYVVSRKIRKQHTEKDQPLNIDLIATD